jgi:hypothetical protein
MHAGDIGRERGIRVKDGSGFAEGAGKKRVEPVILYWLYVPSLEGRYIPDQTDFSDSLVMRSAPRTLFLTYYFL